MTSHPKSPVARPGGSGPPGVAPLYGRIAALYDAAVRLSGIRRGIVQYLDRLDPCLPGTARILDAGCGTGLVSFWALRRFPGAEIVAFDLDRRMLALMARKTALHARGRGRLLLAEGDLNRPDRLRHFDTGRSLVLAEDSFDAILVGAALEHASLERALPGLHRLLRPGGLLINLGVRRSNAMAVLGWVYRFRMYDASHLSATLVAAGFAGVRVERLRLRDFPANLTRLATVGYKRDPLGAPAIAS